MIISVGFQTCEQSVDSKKLNEYAEAFFKELEAGKQCHSNLYEVYKRKDDYPKSKKQKEEEKKEATRVLEQ